MRFNESLHRCSFLRSLIRVWSFFFFFFPCTGFPPKSFTLLLTRAEKKEAAQLFYHRLFAGSCAGISSLCHVMRSIVIQQKKPRRLCSDLLRWKARSSSRIRWTGKSPPISSSVLWFIISEVMKITPPSLIIDPHWPSFICISLILSLLHNTVFGAKGKFCAS